MTGTGGGFKRFTVGETDISNASRPIKAKEMKAAKENGIEFIELPVAYDGLSICVNRNNYWATEMTVDHLKKLFSEGSNIRTWNDLNPEWPKTQVMMFIPGTDSGTFDYFKEVVLGKKGNVRADVTVSEDDNVLVQGIAGNEGAIGFFGSAYYFENRDKLRSVAIENPAGDFVSPTPDSIESGEYAPFSRPLFIYVNKKSAQKPEVRAFVEFYFDVAPRIAEEVGYVKLPARVYNIAQRNFKRGKAGTHFHDEAGNSIEGSLTQLFR